MASMISNRLSRWTLLYFAFALINFVAAQLLILSGDTWPTTSVSSVGTLIAVHLLTIGWLLILMLGALFQFIPVITSNVIPSQRLELVILGTMEIGLIGMICGFAGLQSDFTLLIHCLPVGGTLVIVAVLLSGYEIAVPLLKAESLTLPGRMVFVGLMFLLATITLGLLFALAFNVPALATRLAPLLAGGLRFHAMAGLGGWFTLTAMGVSYKLLPMFTLAPEERGLPGELVFYLGSIGFAIALAAGVSNLWFEIRWLSILQLSGYVIISVATIIFLIDVIRIYKTRKRSVIELHNQAAIAAFIYLGLIVISSVFLSLIHAFQAYAACVLFATIFGWLSGLALTQLYKIVPFLTWLQRYGAKLGRCPVPRVQDLVNDQHARLWFVLYFISVAISIFAVIMMLDVLFRVGLMLICISTLGLGIEYWRAWRAVYVVPTSLPKAVQPH